MGRLVSVSKRCETYVLDINLALNVITAKTEMEKMMELCIHIFWKVFTEYTNSSEKIRTLILETNLSYLLCLEMGCYQALRVSSITISQSEIFNITDVRWDKGFGKNFIKMSLSLVTINIQKAISSSWISPYTKHTIKNHGKCRCS